MQSEINLQVKKYEKYNCQLDYNDLIFNSLYKTHLYNDFNLTQIYFKLQSKIKGKRYEKNLRFLYIFAKNTKSENFFDV